MHSRLERSPALAASLIALLAIPQLAGLGRQFARGYRPFGPPPGRVAFAWDMFATRIERCTLSWAPRLGPDAGGIASLRDLGTLLEWDVVYDEIDSYRWAGNQACAAKTGPTRVNLHCYLPEGSEIHDEFDCP